ncbi:helix-turn-helix transcriptional regulator [Streptacidiphilus sp. 4-A2]|nr:helix-turn-helix transcriptional regulator [Streptacidiphilus sp. 4-A2]
MVTRTAAERREEARMTFEKWFAECPGRQLLDRVGDRWTCVLLRALSEEQQRYSDLLRKVPAVSQKMLTQTLRTMERDGLVSRQITPSVPVRVDYELTVLGRSLLPVVDVISAWANTHMDEVNEARRAYDSALDENLEELRSA